MLKKRKRLWYILSLQTGLFRQVVYQIIFPPTMGSILLNILKEFFFCVSVVDYLVTARAGFTWLSLCLSPTLWFWTVVGLGLVAWIVPLHHLHQ